MSFSCFPAFLIIRRPGRQEVTILRRLEIIGEAVKIYTKISETDIRKYLGKGLQV